MRRRACFRMLGSPPQVRGKLAVCRGDSVFNGITPAGAGKTRYARRCTDFTWDHPRRCGENIRLKCIAYPRAGSPPQVRGKQNENRKYSKLERITPAGAGKTQSRKSVTASLWDHPRRCGENASRSAAAQSRAGSPPQVRGKPEGISKYGDYGRITPAGAGKTASPSAGSRFLRDHPRRCGENGA